MKIKKNIVYKDFEVMYAIEKEYYNEEFITSVDESFKWYKYRKESFMCIEDEESVKGFMCLFPIENTLYQEIKTGKFNDADLKYTDIIAIDDIKPGNNFNLFLSCIALTREIKGSQGLRILLNSYKELYEKKKQNNISFNNIIIDVATVDGENFAKKMGFNYLCESSHDTKIFEIKYDEFIENIRN